MARGRPRKADGTAPTAAKQKENGANLGFEAQLFLAADKLRKNLEPSDYKHVALGLIFLKHISNAFEAKRAALLAEDAAAAEDPDEYLAENVFWVPKEARWSHLQANAKQPTIGKLIDEAMAAIEKAQPRPQGRAAQGLQPPGARQGDAGRADRPRSPASRWASRATRRRTSSGRVYEYFLGGFAGSEGKRGGEFYTPRSVVRVLVEMLEPYKGRVYDPCCGSGGMFVQSEKFVESHGGRIGDIAIYGQESQLHDLAARQDEPRGARHRRRHPLEQRGQLPQGRTEGPALRLHPRQSAVQRLRLGRRAAARGCALDLRRAAGRQRQLRLAPAHPLASRAERHGGRRAGQRLDVVGTVGRGRDPQGDGRGRRGRLHGRAAGPAFLLDADSGLPLVPRPQQEPRRQAARPARRGAVHRRAQARHAGGPHPQGVLGRRHRQDRRHLSCLARRGRRAYEDVPGFCKAAKLEEIRGHNHVLTPGRYVGAADVEDDDVPFAERFAALRAKLEEQFAEADELDRDDPQKLARIGVNGCDWPVVQLGRLVVDASSDGISYGICSATGTVRVQASFAE